MNSSASESLGFIQNLELNKYPRTAHLEGSRLQKGDSTGGKDHVPYSKLAGKFIVVEEKLDGANTGISFTPGAELLLQSRGHYLLGGAREAQFGPFKRWAVAQESRLLGVLEDRYVMYGEMMAKKHSVFYDNLPHIFTEFDILDRQTSSFLGTAERFKLLSGVPVLPVPLLYSGVAPTKLSTLLEMLKPSLAKTSQWRSVFESTVKAQNLDLELAWKQCDKSDLAEGLYIKVEENGVVTERYKWVRSDFTQTILDCDVHHSAQPLIKNKLNPKVDLYSERLTVTWESLANEIVNG